MVQVKAAGRRPSEDPVPHLFALHAQVDKKGRVDIPQPLNHLPVHLNPDLSQIAEFAVSSREQFAQEDPCLWETLPGDGFELLRITKAPKADPCDTFRIDVIEHGL